MSNHEAAREYHRRGLPITLCPSDAKNPLGEGWSESSSGQAWQKKTWTLPEIDRAFRLRGELNVGCLWGARSRMIDIEEDSPEAKEAFAELFDGINPPVTPVFKSTRGPHRLFAWHPRLNEIGKATTHFKSLEIKLGANGKGSQSLLPPSSTNGVTREWLVSLDECDPAPLPEIVIQRIKDACLQRDRVNGETEAIASVNSVSSVNSVHSGSLSLCKHDPVDIAIAASLPANIAARHRKIFEFARQLKAIPSLADADPKSLKPIVKRWHEFALPVIGTKPFEETWIDFVNGWKNVRFPAGQEPVRMIYDEAISKPMPTIASNFEPIEIRRLIVLCRALQHNAGDKPFFLACRTAGVLLGISHVMANKWLRLLAFEDVLKVVTVGAQGKASRFRYLGD